MNSVWADTSKPPVFPALAGNLTTDVLIIGGGMAGILCAYMLSQAGIDYVLVEADRICRGVSGNTTAKITATQVGAATPQIQPMAMPVNAE